MSDHKYDIETLDWVEAHALENAKFGIESYDSNKKGAEQLILILIAAIGSGIGYVLANLESGPVTITVGCITLYLATIGVVVCVKCLITKVIYPAYNEPDKMLFELPLETNKLANLKVIQRVVDTNFETNRHLVWWLDRCRVAIVLSPVVTVLFWAVANFL